MSSVLKTAAAPVPFVVDYTADNEEGLKYFKGIVAAQTRGQKCTSYFDHPQYPTWVDLANEEDVNRRAKRIVTIIGRNFSVNLAKLIAEYGPLLSQRLLVSKLLKSPSLGIDPEKTLFQKRSLAPVFRSPFIKRLLHTIHGVSESVFELRRNKESGQIWRVVHPTYFERIQTIVRETPPQTKDLEHLRPVHMTEGFLWDAQGMELSIRGKNNHRHIISIDLFLDTFHAAEVFESDDASDPNYTDIQCISYQVPVEPPAPPKKPSFLKWIADCAGLLG